MGALSGVFVFQHFDQNVNEFEGWSLEKFLDDFDVDNHIYSDYMESIPSDYAVLNEEEEKNFKLYLKALFAQQIFDINAYFKIVNAQDIMLERVVQLNEEGYPLEP